MTSSTLQSSGYRYPTAGLYKAVLRLTDECQKLTYDTVRVTVVQDVPMITFLSGDTIVNFGGTVRCSVYVKQQFGTMTVGIDTANSGTYKSLGNLGLSGGEEYSFSTGNASAWDSVKIRVTDSKGNMVTKGFRVRIRPRPLTITSIDSTVNTITVHYSQSQETDFTKYRIYRNTTTTVDTTCELWVTITAIGTVSYTTPSPSYAWNPRYYRVYQADAEGLWSAGSNVVYGCIVNSPPNTPVITYPANNGDSIWPINDTLRWHTCNDPNGNGVRYKVLVNYNNFGYSQLATSLMDTFVQLLDTLPLKFKVMAYDTLGDSSGWSTERSALIRTLMNDTDGNVYKIVTIGTQVWMAENLKTTKYNDGSMIPLVIDSTAWSNLKTPGYCWYNNDLVTYGNIYGVLYNWYTVNTGKLAPLGWHVPTYDEWIILINFLGGSSVAGGAMKDTGTTYWQSPNIGATNTSGFMALPGGERDWNTGDFYSIGYGGEWWSSTSSGIWPTGTPVSLKYGIGNSEANIGGGQDFVNVGCSVRCVRNP